MKEKQNDNDDAVALISSNGLIHILKGFYERKDSKALLSMLPGATCASVLAICEGRAAVSGDSIKGFKIDFDGKDS